MSGMGVDTRLMSGELRAAPRHVPHTQCLGTARRAQQNEHTASQGRVGLGGPLTDAPAEEE